MSTDLSDTPESVHDLERAEFDHPTEDSVAGDLMIFWAMSSLFAFVGAAIVMMGWYGVLLAQYVPRALIGAVGVAIGIALPVGVFVMFRSEYPGLFMQLRRLPSRMEE